MIELHAHKNNLKVYRGEKITSGSVGVNILHFCFSKEWLGCAKTVLFRVGKLQMTVILDENDSCTIPWECLSEYGKILYVGLYGSKGGELCLPTIWASLGEIKEGANIGEENEPTPSQYDQLMNKIIETEEKIPMPMTAEELRQILTQTDDEGSGEDET